ncbi:RNA-binding protein spenito [Rhodnius prolixus]
MSGRSDKAKLSMKRRSSSRDSPPIRSKRSRSSIGRYDDSSDERLSPDRLRRRSRMRSPTPRRYPSPGSHRSDYRSSRDLADRASYPSFKVLCVSALHPKASDEVIKDTLYREYKKFGDLSIRISHDLDERVAYVCFRNSEDARDAKRNKPRIILFDKVALVEPVYESRSTTDYRPVSPRLRPRSRSLTPDERFYRSPEHRAPERYDRIYGPHPVMPYREYRHEVPPMHHEFIRGPPMPHMPPHMPPVPPHHYGPPRHMLHGFRPPPPHFEHKIENKKDKFPNYLHHVPPEDDPLATRTLFAGNLEVNISDEELRRIFGRYGIVEDIDIKRPLPGTGNAYAFVRYQNLDMAHRSKVELSGQYIGKFQCKIGYGKATPTTRIWVGGLGAWTSLSQLEREFDRFGAIKKIDYLKGDTQAYILYDSIDAATAAVKEMRGFPLGGPEHKLRVDFADVNPVPPMKPKPLPGEEIGGEFRVRDAYPYPDPHYEAWNEGDYYARGFRGRGGAAGAAGWPGDRRGAAARPAYRGNYSEEEWRRPEEYDGRYKRPGSGEGSPGAGSVESDDAQNCHLSSIRLLSDLAKKCTTVWSGALILKNSLFPTKCHLTDGDREIIDLLMKDEEGKPLLRITQRLRLDQPKLDDVSKRISSSTSHAIFLGLTGTTTIQTDTTVQTRPLRNLVSYLKQKEAAGVISLINKDTEITGVLYAFPPCSFSADLLKRTAHSLSPDTLKEDHLVIVVVRGGTA